VKQVLALVAALLAVPPLSIRWPAQGENASATRLQATVERFGGDLQTIRRGVVSPAFLEKHANTIRTLRAQIVSNDRPVWKLSVDDILEPPLPPLAMHMRLFAVLRADALQQHAAGRDTAAWADLHAIWILSRSLLQRPEWISISVASIGDRMIASAAPQIGPPPAWWSEFALRDTRTPRVRSLEYQAWLLRTQAERYPLGEPDGTLLDAVRDIAAPLARPFRVLQANLAIRQWPRDLVTK
jgi:hypothetical protein